MLIQIYTKTQHYTLHHGNSQIYKHNGILMSFFMMIAFWISPSLFWPWAGWLFPDLSGWHRSWIFWVSYSAGIPTCSSLLIGKNPVHDACTIVSQYFFWFLPETLKLLHLTQGLSASSLGLCAPLHRVHFTRPATRLLVFFVLLMLLAGENVARETGSSPLESALVTDMLAPSSPPWPPNLNSW